VKLAPDLKRCEDHKMSRLSLPHLEKILSIKLKTQGPTRLAFNKQIRTQVDEVKVQRSSNLRLAYQFKSRVTKSNTGMSLALVVHIQKRLKS